MRKKCGRLLACLLIGAMLLLQGCKGREDGSDGQTGGGDGNSPAPEASAESESNGEKSIILKIFIIPNLKFCQHSISSASVNILTYYYTQFFKYHNLLCYFY